MILLRNHKIRVQRFTALVSVLCWLVAGDGVATALNLWLGARDGIHQSFATLTQDGRTVLMLSHADDTQADPPGRSLRFVSICPDGSTQDHQVSQIEIESSQHRKLRHAPSQPPFCLTASADSVSLAVFTPDVQAYRPVGWQGFHWHQGMLVRASRQVLRC